MANKLEKIKPPPPPPPPAGTVSTSCRNAVRARVFKTFNGRGYRITPVGGSSDMRWRLDNPADPFIWYVTGSCSGGYVTLTLSNVRRAP